MNPLLQALIDAASGLLDPANFDVNASNEERVAAVRQALADYKAAHPDENIDLSALDAEILTVFEERRAAAGSSAEGLAALGAVADVADALDAEIRAAQANQAGADALADRLAGRAPRDAAGINDTPPADAPEAPPAAPEGGTGDAPEGGTGDAPEGDAPAAPEGDPALVAGGRRPPTTTTPRVPMGALPNDDRSGGGTSAATYALTASADIPGVPMGTELDGMSGLVSATVARLTALGRAGKDTSAGIATLERTDRDPRTIATGVNGIEAINYVCDESRLEGGSLVAAASWCAPTPVSYDFCPTAKVYGILSVPEIEAERGSLSWPVSPDFAALYTQTGFYLTNADMAKGEVWDPANPATFRPNKPCYLIECPPNARLDLDVMGICVKSPTLTERAYPELIEYVMAQILVAHQHKRNAVILRKIEDLTVKVTLPGANAPEWGPGAIATALGVIELQVQYLRARNRLGDDEVTIEMVAPTFMRSILRSDLSKRAGVDLISVTNATLDSYLRNIGVAPQWVVDWQDAFAGAATPINPDPTAAAPGTGLPVYDPAAWGGNTPPVAWPSTVRVMLYPAGTYFVATNDVITVDGMYDSALLQRNLHLSLFTEEGIQVGTRGCYQGITVTLPLCPSGQTGAPIPDAADTWSCANGAA